MSDEKNDGDSLFKSKLYFSLGDAVNDVSCSYGIKDTSIASAKLLGKTLCNTVVFAGKFGLEMAKRAPEMKEKQEKIQRENKIQKVKQAKKYLKENPDLEPEKRKKIEQFINSFDN